MTAETTDQNINCIFFHSNLKKRESEITCLTQRIWNWNHLHLQSVIHRNSCKLRKTKNSFLENAWISQISGHDTEQYWSGLQLMHHWQSVRKKAQSVQSLQAMKHYQRVSLKFKDRSILCEHEENESLTERVSFNWHIVEILIEKLKQNLVEQQSM